MAQQVNQTQDTREMHLGIYVTGTDASAVSVQESVGISAK